MSRVYNFAAGPAVLPLESLQEAQADLVDFQGSGMSIMEMSHRGKVYDAVHNEARENLKKLMGLGDDYEVLFIQGGASLQFAMIPMNWLGKDQTADYINSGSWGAAAVKQAQMIGNVNIAANTQKEIPTRMPTLEEMKWTPGAAYSHITTNETIAGTELKEIPETGSPLIGDMSSDILSCPRDYTKYAMIYAGAQKNLGPSGVAVVAIRKDFAERGAAGIPTMLRYQTHLEKNSLYNTPPCFAIYMIGLTTKWLLKQGLETVYANNAEKAKKIYDVIDSTAFYRGTALKECRSNMNVTFRLPTEELEALFVKQAAENGMVQLKGHRSVGGIRASIYNAFPVEGVDRLVDFMAEFEKRFG